MGPRPARQGRQGPLITAQAAATAEAPAQVDEKSMQLAINAIRFLSIDAVDKANSGHPGLPMGCAPMAYVLFNEFINMDAKHPQWFNRDRFVLSAGHGSMLLYSVLHLLGYSSVTLEDCKNFRQWKSQTPGHPENFVTEGIEVTTGPLGQGIANSVGLAAAEAHLAARFNKDDAKVVDHYTYCILGDGCNMEGISNEACSLAGHWGLGKLIALYDDNKISIDGHTEISFTEDVSARFEALGWHVQHVEDGNTDLKGIKAAVEKARAVTDKPSFIKVSTLIGYGSPNKANTHGVHGSPLGKDETAATREALKWPYKQFEIPQEAYDAFQPGKNRSQQAFKKWTETYESYKSKYPEEAKELDSIITGKLPEGWADALVPEDKELATRLHSQTMLNKLAPIIPGFWGGSADLAPSNMTLMKMFGDFQKNQYEEKNLRFGVREHGMGAITNGIALHSPGFIPYCATFFIFTDYMRSSIRMAALSQAGSIFVMTHDSIGLGEDGPTHQPVEHLASFRAMPNINMLRPGDGTETAGAYKASPASPSLQEQISSSPGMRLPCRQAAVLRSQGMRPVSTLPITTPCLQVAVLHARGQNKVGHPTPSILALSRQGMPNLPGTSVEGVEKGGYIVHGGDEKPDVILLSTGTELHMAVEAAERLEKEGKKARVVSMIGWELFEQQPQSYKAMLQDSVLPPDVTARVSLEAGSTFGWERYVGPKGIAIGIDEFGHSAPGPTLYKENGITADNVYEQAKKLL
eukprot:jgi/Astpho2/2735/Aster-00916